MDTFTLKLHLDNAAFEDDSLGPETARILRKLADDIENESRAGLDRGFSCRDINGNGVGLATFDLEDKEATAAHEAQVKAEKVIEAFVKQMSTEDIRLALDKLFNITYPADAKRNSLNWGLIYAITSQDASITIKDISDLLEGKYK